MGKGSLSDFWLEHWLSVSFILRSFSILHSVKSLVLNDINPTSPFPVSHATPLIVCISFVQMSTLRIDGAWLVCDWWWLMCFGTPYLFIIHELAFLLGFICGQSLQLHKSRWHLSSHCLRWPETLSVKDKLRLSHLIFRCDVCITVRQGKGARGGDMVCDCWPPGILNLYPALHQSQGWTQNRQRAAGFCFPTDRSAACFMYRLYTRRLSSERNTCFGIAEPTSALILVARSMLMLSSVFSRTFLLLTQLVTFKVP